MKLKSIHLLVVALLGLCAQASQASFIPLLASPAPGGSSNLFSYNLVFSTNGGVETLNPGDFITLYDFDASIVGVVASPNISVSAQLTGVTPAGGLVNPTDNPAINNVTFTFLGPATNADANFFANITLNAPYTTKVGQFTSTDQIPSNGSALAQIGAVLIPTAVPEPASLGLISIAGLALLTRRRSA